MKALLTFSLSLFSFAVALSQTTDQPVETQSKIRVFEPSKAVKSSGDNSYKWAVKTDIFSILTGEFPIIGEYRIAEKFSVEASAGITYGFIPSGLFESDDFGGSDGEVLDSDNAEMGSAFRVAFKYFPSSDYDAIEGWYFGVQLMTKTTNRSYGEIIDGFDGEDQKVKTGASIIVGKQIFQDSNVMWDFYFGAGICDVKHTYYSRDYDLNTFNKIETAKSQPNILLGLRIGFGN